MKSQYRDNEIVTNEPICDNLGGGVSRRNIIGILLNYYHTFGGILPNLKPVY